MKTTISLIFWLMIPAALIGAPTVVMMLGTERQAMVGENHQLSADDVERAASLLMRYDPTRMTKDQVTTIVAREDELNVALAAGLADRHPARGRVMVGASGVQIDATAKLPEFTGIMGNYVNMVASVAPSRRGLDITGFRIGKIELPKWLATPAMQILLEGLLGAGKGAHITENIQSVDISGKTVAIGYRPTGRGLGLAQSNRRRNADPVDLQLLSAQGQRKLGYNQTDADVGGSQN